LQSSSYSWPKRSKKQWNLLLRTKGLLERKGIPYWIESGTLLGLVRDGAPLAYAKNVNIGIPAEYIENLRAINPYCLPPHVLKRSFDRSGIEWIQGYECNFYLRPAIPVRRSAIAVHITPRHRAGDTVRWIDGVDGRTCKAVSSRFYEELDAITVKGVTFPVPHDTEEYLTGRYGDWRTPVRDWNTNVDDGAIVDRESLARQNIPPKTRNSDIRHRFRTKMRLAGKDLLRAKAMLQDTAAVLERNNIPYWLDAGTLLGIVRDKELIPWDYDIDLGVPGTYVKQVLALKRQFLPKYRLLCRLDSSGRLPDIYRACKVKLVLGKLSLLKNKEELHLDIFFNYRIDDHYYWIDSNVRKRVHARFRDSLDTLAWNGRTYSVPARVEDYLEQRYGKDWRTPKEDYDASVEDKSIYA
jgi:phosphorylcholine metabolism protein LicD